MSGTLKSMKKSRKMTSRDRPRYRCNLKAEARPRITVSPRNRMEFKSSCHGRSLRVSIQSEKRIPTIQGLDFKEIQWDKWKKEINRAKISSKDLEIHYKNKILIKN